MVFHKKGCWILNKWHLSNDANYFEVRRKVSIKIDKLISGVPNVNFRKISVRKTISDPEFSEHLL